MQLNSGAQSARRLVACTAHPCRQNWNTMMAVSRALLAHNHSGRPYRFKTAEKLIDDFFDEIERGARSHPLVTVA
jgi:hypothetical protein